MLHRAGEPPLRPARHAKVRSRGTPHQVKTVALSDHQLVWHTTDPLDASVFDPIRPIVPVRCRFEPVGRLLWRDAQATRASAVRGCQAPDQVGPRQWTVLLSGRIKRSWAAVSVVLVGTAVAAVATFAATSGSTPPRASSGSGRVANSAPSRLLRPALGFAAAKRTAGAPGRTAHADHHDGANDFRPGRARRLPRAPAPAAPALTAAVAPGGPRDVTSAGEGAGAVDLPRRGAHRKGHVDLGVGQH